MVLNKSSSHALLRLLAGRTTAAEIAKAAPGVDVRTIQRAISRLLAMGLVERLGSSNNPSYGVGYDELIRVTIADKLLEDEARPATSFNHALLDWLEGQSVEQLDAVFGNTQLNLRSKSANKMSARDLEYLTIELAWRSSALEGNTYTLLDTQLLLTEGIKAKNRTEFETQMIINHKDAVAFIVENPELFSGTVGFRSVEELHRIIGKNLGIDAGVRRKIVKITATNYQPMAGPQQLREAIDRILAIVSKPRDPFARALLALGLVPYLQTFEDGNKRTGRMLANAILIISCGTGFSLRNIEARDLAMAYLKLYEFNSFQALQVILSAQLESGKSL